MKLPSPFVFKIFFAAGSGRRPGSPMNSLRSAWTAVLASRPIPNMKTKGDCECSLLEVRFHSKVFTMCSAQCVYHVPVLTETPFDTNRQARERSHKCERGTQSACATISSKRLVLFRFLVLYSKP